MCRVVAFVVSSAAVAVAQEKPRVAVMPLAAPGVDDVGLVRELDAETSAILAATGRLVLVAPDQVAKRLVDEPGGKCPTRGKERMDCLERVALATRATYTIAVTVKRFGSEYELSAALADADKVPLQQAGSLTVRDDGNTKVAGALKHQLKMLLLDGVKAAELPPDPRMRNPQVVTPNPNPIPGDPPPVPPPFVEAPVEKGMSPLRVTSIVVGAGAAVLAVTAIGLGVSAQADRGGLATLPDGTIQEGSMANLDRAASIRTRATIATMAGVGAGVFAAAAVVLFIASSGSSSSESTTVITPTVSGSGAGFAVTGSF